MKPFVLFIVVFCFGVLMSHVLRPAPAQTEIKVVYQAPRPDYVEARVTAYTNAPGETDGDPENTAIMEKPVAGWTCAVSRDLMHWLGGRVYIEGMGVRRVNDLMNERFSERVDVFIGTVKEARAFGVQNRKVIFLGR